MSAPTPNGERLALAAAANVLFWSAVADRTLGRAWPGIALSITAMAQAARGSSSPAFELLNLPGNVAAQVLKDRVAAPCSCSQKDSPQ
jgi:hypothetical protein